jgi:hypothetical protein
MSTITSISGLAQKFRQMVTPLDVDSYYKIFHTTPQHDGSPHIEMENGEFQFVVTERGTEFERIKNLSADEILYLLFKGITLSMATQYELRNRIEGIDGRSTWFPYQESLMEKLNPLWGIKLKAEHERILMEHPFHS